MTALRGLYAITPLALTLDDGLLDSVEAAVRGGAAVVQYRDKSGDPAQRLDEATALQELCTGHGVPLIINDDVELALAVGAAGVHLGKDDGDIQRARERIGSGILGVSCYNRWRNAQHAKRAGADYIAFGAFYGSTTKPNAAAASPELLQQARSTLDLPVVAIGGITPDNGAALVHAGADMLAAIGGLFDAPDIGTAARGYAQLFEQRIERTESYDAITRSV